MKVNYAVVTRAALLLALTLVFQSLRFMIPIPFFFSIFLIGSLVNMCLLVAVETVGFKYTLIIVFLAPVVAYFQQLLPLPLFILPVALGNVIYIGVHILGRQWHDGLRIGIGAFSKFMFMYAAFSWLLTLLALPDKLAGNLLLVMSWPQFVTGVIGGITARIMNKRLQLLMKK